MGEIKIIVDLPSESMLNTLRLQPLDGPYSSARLKKALEQRLAREFPGVKKVTVNVVAANAYFGADVMGTRVDEVLETMKKLSEAISSVVKEEADGRVIKR